MDIYHFKTNSGPIFCKSKTALIWWKVCSFNSFISSHWFQYKDDIISFLILFSLLCHSQSFLEIFVISSAFFANLFVFFSQQIIPCVFLNYSLINFIKNWFLRFKWDFSLSKQQFQALWSLLMNRFQMSQGCRASKKRQFI